MKIKETRVLPPVPVPQRVGVSGGDPEDTEIRKKREKIKEVISREWWFGVLADTYLTEYYVVLHTHCVCSSG